MTEKTANPVDLLQADVEQLVALDASALVNAASGIANLGLALEAPKGFVPPDLNGGQASYITDLLPHVQSALNPQPNSPELAVNPTLMESVKVLLPGWYNEVAKETPRRWFRLFLKTEGAVDGEAFSRFPEYVRTEVGAVAVRKVLAPLVTVAGAADQYPALVDEASRAIQIVQERAKQTATGNITDTDIAFGVTSLWIDLLSQNQHATEQLPTLSAMVAARLNELAIRPDRLANSNITVPTPEKIAYDMPRFLAEYDGMLPGAVDQEVLAEVSRIRNRGIVAILAAANRSGDWRWAVKGTLSGLKQLWEARTGAAVSEPDDAPSAGDRVRRLTANVRASTERL